MLPGDGWEIFILMEFCSGGGLIDFLNTRLQHRLIEREVLSIFRDICAGVQVMHHLDPVLVHRDLKIENVLLTNENPPRFKLCDFGSAFALCTSQPARTASEIQRLEQELNTHTTMQYRAPEMIDLGSQQPISEKADIWALGVLLYKLCYYTTPFEGPGAGPAAILRGRYDYPPKPMYSAELKTLVSSMLQVEPAARPNIDQVLAKVQGLLGQEPNKPLGEPKRLSCIGASAAPMTRSQSTPTSTLRETPASVAPSRVGPLATAARPPPAKPPTKPLGKPPAKPPAKPPMHRALPDDASRDDTSARFPSVEELDQQQPVVGRRSVREIVGEMNSGRPKRFGSPPPAIAIAVHDSPVLEDRVLRPDPVVSDHAIVMQDPSVTSNKMPTREAEVAPARPAHTLVDVDVASSDDDTEPEDIEGMFRVRPRNAAQPAHEPSNPAASLRELLVETSASDDVSQNAPAPRQEELAKISEHEKALRALLGDSDTPETSEVSRHADRATPPSRSSPARSDEFMPPRSLKDMAAQYEVPRDRPVPRPKHPTSQLSTPRSPGHVAQRMSMAHSASRRSSLEMTAQRGTAEAQRGSPAPSERRESPAPHVSSPEAFPLRRESLQSPPNPPVGNLLDFDMPSAAAQRAPTWDDDEPGAPRPTSQLEDSERPQGAVPQRRAETPRHMAAAAAASAALSKPPKAPPTHRERSSTWDVSVKCAPAPAPKTYVDASTSPGLNSPIVPSLEGGPSLASQAGVQRDESTPSGARGDTDTARQTANAAAPRSLPETEPTHKPDSARHAAARAVDSALRSEGVRLTKRTTQGGSGTRRPVLRPWEADATTPTVSSPTAQDEPEAPFESVSERVRRWQMRE